MKNYKPPYKELKKDGYLYREFTTDIDNHELIWHKDKKDRIVYVLEETDWLIQFDNKLPEKLKDTVFIPKKTYHRIIKGIKPLIIKIKEF